MKTLTVTGKRRKAGGEAETEVRAEPASVKPSRRHSPRGVTVRAEPPASATPKAREGKTMIAGYFTPDLARAIKILAVEHDLTVQALIGEGLDMVLSKYGKTPRGER